MAFQRHEKLTFKNVKTISIETQSFDNLHPFSLAKNKHAIKSSNIPKINKY